jgi:hypothetical protein
MIPLFVSTELVVDRIEMNAPTDIWERVGDRFIWSRRLGWQWWQVLRANFDAASIAHIRAALVAERGEDTVRYAESLTIPTGYRLPPGCDGWIIYPRRAA